ncbi:ATP-binding protein [Streptomyces sp. NPDC008079]|uniref:ATP-binding protein n=1 Tax=Streptomyces sp. NPDC008079 TaxID=3364806 RepID=UPI0036ED4403
MSALPCPESATLVWVRRWSRSPRRVQQARRELRDVLNAWGLGELAESAELVLSELLTNAVCHARPPYGREIETRCEREGGGVRIEVHDASEKRPVLRKVPTDAEEGRGLALVEAITGAQWGVSKREGVGKLVWAVVSVDGNAE